MESNQFMGNPNVNGEIPDGPKGLGGWLVLIGIGIVFSPIYLLFTAIPMFLPIFTDGTWELITTVGSEIYNPTLAIIIIGEISYNVSILLMSLYLIYLYFTKHYLFPKIYIVCLAIQILFTVFDSWLVASVLENVEAFDFDTLSDLMRMIGAAVIWIPYMLVSKRVKATFVRDKQPIQPYRAEVVQ